MSGTQEFTVKIPQRNEKKNHYVMKFNSSLAVDVAKWSQVRMVRENNQKVKNPEEEQPKFGAGSEFGREQKEEARRKKWGMVSKKYDPDAQPWLMRVGSKKEGKHYRGLREGGVSNNTTYYVFTHAQDGSFEVHPVKEWYNFTPRATYKTLNAEEAEEKFEQRNKILNKWAVMVNKKVRPDGPDGEGGDDDDDEGGSKGKSGKGKGANKSFKVSDMDDWVDDEDGLDTDEDEEDEADSKKKKGKKDKDEGGKDSRKKKKKSKYDVENEAFEDSDDGDDEHREVDYITDESSEGEDELQQQVELKGVEQDEGLSKLLDSASSSEDSDEEEKKDKDDKDKEEDDKDDSGKKKKGKGKKSKGDKDSPDGKGKGGSAPGSRSNSPGPSDMPDTSAVAKAAKAEKAEKRKALVDGILDPNASGPEAKRPRTEASGSAEAMFEEDVRRYLARKPMTTTEILKKINTRKTGIPKEELMPLLVSALKRINPHKQKVKGIMYLSLKQ